MKIHSILLGEFCSERFLNRSVSILRENVACGLQWRGLEEFEKMLFVNGKENAF